MQPTSVLVLLDLHQLMHLCAKSDIIVSSKEQSVKDLIIIIILTQDMSIFY